MKERYEETEITLGGRKCVAYLIKLKSLCGKEYFVPKISPVKEKDDYCVLGESGGKDE